MTEIDDEMVERAYGWSPKGCGIQRWQIRDMLTAALNPKPEPEIEVSEGMMEAGRCAALVPGLGYSHARMAQIYRAMESTRLKEAETLHVRPEAYTGTKDYFKRAAQEGAAYAAKPAPQGVSSGAPVKETGGGVPAGMVLIKDRRTSWHERRAIPFLSDVLNRFVCGKERRKSPRRKTPEAQIASRET